MVLTTATLSTSPPSVIASAPTRGRSTSLTIAASATAPTCPIPITTTPSSALARCMAGWARSSIATSQTSSSADCRATKAFNDPHSATSNPITSAHQLPLMVEPLTRSEPSTGMLLRAESTMSACSEGSSSRTNPRIVVAAINSGNKVRKP